MSFVGGPFGHDVFVSYSHGDIQGVGDLPLKLWSQSFARELKREMQVEINATLDLFLDENERSGEGIDRMAPLSDDLKSHLGRSAILAVLMTPHYLGSEWCRQELDWWVEAQQRHGIRHENQLAIARVLPTGKDEWPTPLTDTAGHQHVGVHFFDRNIEGTSRPFGWPKVTSETGGRFREAVVLLAGLI